jgi:protein-disulfide isomerase
MSPQIATGTTSDGHPWIGAENPLLEITEFSDYQCFQCKKMHFFIRRLIANNPEKIRLVHRHYPMDHAFNPIVKTPFHVGSGAMALLAIYAVTQDRFWDMNDLLYEMAGKNKDIGLKEVASRSGLDLKKLKGALRDPGFIKKLNQDLAGGMKLGLTGTPGYLIDDTLFLGQIPPQIIKKALE